MRSICLVVSIPCAAYGMHPLACRDDRGPGASSGGDVDVHLVCLIVQPPRIRQRSTRPAIFSRTRPSILSLRSKRLLLTNVSQLRLFTLGNPCAFLTCCAELLTRTGPRTRNFSLAPKLLYTVSLGTARRLTLTRVGLGMSAANPSDVNDLPAKLGRNNSSATLMRVWNMASV